MASHVRPAWRLIVAVVVFLPAVGAASSTQMETADLAMIRTSHAATALMPGAAPVPQIERAQDCRVSSNRSTRQLTPISTAQARIP